MLLAYWGYVLLCIHAGTHMLPIFTSRIVKGLKKGVLCVTVGALSLYGIAAFVKRGFPEYMFGKTVFAFFDYAEPRVYFFIDYIAIMILFMMMGCLLTYVLNMISNKSPIR